MKHKQFVVAIVLVVITAFAYGGVVAVFDPFRILHIWIAERIVP